MLDEVFISLIFYRLFQNIDELFDDTIGGAGTPDYDNQIHVTDTLTSHSPIVRKGKRNEPVEVEVQMTDEPESESEDGDVERGNQIYVKNPRPEDIISVRGCGKSQYGNVLFRELIIKHKAEYDANTDQDYRRDIGIRIVDQLKPGRFLKKRNKTDSHYYVMTRDLSIQKTVFAMRDCRASAKLGKNRNQDKR